MPVSLVFTQRGLIAAFGAGDEAVDGKGGYGFGGHGVPLGAAGPVSCSCIVNQF